MARKSRRILITPSVHSIQGFSRRTAAVLTFPAARRVFLPIFLTDVSNSTVGLCRGSFLEPYVLRNETVFAQRPRLFHILSEPAHTENHMNHSALAYLALNDHTRPTSLSFSSFLTLSLCMQLQDHFLISQTIRLNLV